MARARVRVSQARRVRTQVRRQRPPLRRAAPDAHRVRRSLDALDDVGDAAVGDLAEARLGP